MRDVVNAPRRLLFVSNSARGEYTGRFRWIDVLRARGYEVAFAVPTGEEWHARRITEAGVRVHTYPIDPRGIDPEREMESARRLAAILGREQPDVVHAFGHKANVHSLLAARWERGPALLLHVTGLGQPFVARRPGPRDRLLRTVLRQAYRHGARRAVCILFENEDDRAEFAFVPAHKAAVVCASGVDADALDPARVDPRALAALRRELSLDADDVVLTFVGRLLVEKGMEDLAAAMHHLAREFPRLRLLVVGPDEPGHVMPRAAMPEGRVRWLGRREDVREILAMTDVFVNPSYYREGLPRVNLEAAAMCVPLVTTDLPGCRELPRRADCGLLVPPRDSRALGAALARLASDPALRRRLGQEGRRLVRSRYTVATVIDRLHAIYASTAAARA